jgi:hypothetical protein
MPIGRHLLTRLRFTALRHNLPVMPDPASRDHENAAFRQVIADRQREEFRRVLAFADSIMGPGWFPHGRHSLIDIDEEDRARREGTPAKAAATVYTVTNGVRKRHFMVGEDGKADGSSGHCRRRRERSGR